MDNIVLTMKSAAVLDRRDIIANMRMRLCAGQVRLRIKLECKDTH